VATDPRTALPVPDAGTPTRCVSPLTPSADAAPIPWPVPGGVDVPWAPCPGDAQSVYGVGSGDALDQFAAQVALIRSQILRPFDAAERTGVALGTACRVPAVPRDLCLPSRNDCLFVGLIL
jgi:hypothetical protein